jgi:hypothetical protein
MVHILCLGFAGYSIHIQVLHTEFDPTTRILQLDNTPPPPPQKKKKKKKNSKQVWSAHILEVLD